MRPQPSQAPSLLRESDPVVGNGAALQLTTPARGLPLRATSGFGTGPTLWGLGDDRGGPQMGRPRSRWWPSPRPRARQPPGRCPRWLPASLRTAMSATSPACSAQPLPVPGPSLPASFVLGMIPPPEGTVLVAVLGRAIGVGTTLARICARSVLRALATLIPGGAGRRVAAATELASARPWSEFRIRPRGRAGRRPVPSGLRS